jgi:hypothetical protein
MSDNAVFDRGLEDKNTRFGAGFITDGDVFVLAAGNCLDVFWSTNDGGKDGAGSFVPYKTGFAHTGTIVNNQGLKFVPHW